MQYETEYENLELKISESKKLLQPNTDKSDLYRDFFALLDEITEIKELTPILLKKLIDRIEIEQGFYQKDDNGKKIKHQRIKIYYRFIGCVDNAP